RDYRSGWRRRNYGGRGMLRINLRAWRDGRRGSDGAEDIAAGAFVFRLPGSFLPVGMKLWIVHGKQLIVLGGRVGIRGHDRLVVDKIKIPDTARDQEEHDEHYQLFLLLHEAVRK